MTDSLLPSLLPLSLLALLLIQVSFVKLQPPKIDMIQLSYGFNDCSTPAFAAAAATIAVWCRCLS